jgi:hypothetical protein
MATLSAPLPQPADPPRRIFRRIRWMFIFTIVGGFTAAAWDGWYHTQNVFDGFFSPPHVMAYAVALILAWLTIGLLRQDFRRWLGVGFRVPTLPYAVPGALVILGAGVVMLGFSGLVLDNFWHTWFGLNETPWSFPHAMIGWSLFIVVLGFVACRLALGEPGWLWKLVLAWLCSSWPRARRWGRSGATIPSRRCAPSRRFRYISFSRRRSICFVFTSRTT